MNDEKILDTINEEIVKMTPDNYGEIVSKCHRNQNQSNNIIALNSRRAKTRKFLAIAAAFAIIFCAVFAFYSPANKIESVIDIDVNPSIELGTDRNDKIVQVSALNADADTILDGMDLKGVDLKIAVNALIGSMLKNGYITDTQNAVLVSVSNDNEAKQQTLLQQISEDINGALNERKVEGAVLSQSLNHEERIAALAEQYGISEGKALFIDYVCSDNPNRTYESLVGLSISELALMLESDRNKLEQKEPNSETTQDSATTAPPAEKEDQKISLSGEVNKTTYIGEEKAKEIAFRDAGADKERVYGLSIGFEQDNGVLVYDLEFSADGYEYEYEINAVSGTIEGREKERDEDYIPVTPSTPSDEPSTNNSSSSKYIGEEKAKEIVLERAGLDSGEISGYSVELDRDGAVAVYEISFNSGAYEYEAEVNAKSGSIREFDREYDFDWFPEKVPTTSSQSKRISEEDAKKAAFDRAGVKSANAEGCICNLTEDDGVSVYEVKFTSGSYEYEIDVNASTGKVRSYDREYRKNADTQTAASVSEGEAKEIALEKAGVKADSVSEYKLWSENDDGIPVYEITFRSGNYKYEIEINAITGKIRDYNREYSKPASSGSVSSVSKDDAKKAALEHAGLTESDIRDCEIELDKENGRSCYEVSFSSGRYEYEYKINAESGRVIFHEKEIDD